MTELVAVKLLYGVCVHHVANGGVGTGRGAVVLLLEGASGSVEHAFSELTGLVDAEPPDLGFDADVGPEG